jgi:predicted Zn-dependent protease
MSWLSELWKRLTGQKKRDTSDYAEPGPVGPGYPGRSEIRVCLNESPALLPGDTTPRPPRTGKCKEGIERWSDVLAEFGKRIVYVDSFVGADCVMPVWGTVGGGHAAHTQGASDLNPGTVTIDVTRYFMEDTDLVELAAHEFGHALGLPHSDNKNDVMHWTSPVSKLSDRDINTARKVLKR